MDKIKITFDNVPEAIEFLIKEVSQLKEIISKTPPPYTPKPHPIEIDAACRIILKAKPTIYRLVREGKIPHSKVGNKLYFFENELLEWISKSKKQTVEMTKKEIEIQMMQGIRHKPKKRKF